MSKMIPGGTSDVQGATPEVQKICVEVKPQAEIMAGRKFDVFVAILYMTQVVNGTNYFIKVYVGGDECIHLRVFEPLPCTGENLRLVEIQTSKTVTCKDPLVYF